MRPASPALVVLALLLPAFAGCLTTEGPREPLDSDGDGYPDPDDVFPDNLEEWVDSDGDGYGDNGDQFPEDPAEWIDSDGDGYGDNGDVFPNDPVEWRDLDGNGVGDNSDDDDDGDGYPDGVEELVGTDPHDNSSVPADFDGDFIPDSMDDDDDNDGYPDSSDAFPLDPAEWMDTDGDGTGDNSDPDDDNDGYPDGSDAFPFDPAEWADSDGDGVGDNSDSGDDRYANFTLEPAFPNLHFDRPVALTHAGDDRLFVVEQEGRIYTFVNDAAVETATLFLDIRDLVNDAGNEEGLLSLAFHPNFQENGYFFVDYTTSDPRRTIISRFALDASDPSLGDPQSEVVLLEIGQPYSNHNGGQIAFGPDGYLYVGMGDGGSGGDPQGHGQDRSTLLGAILRLDIDGGGDENPYSIPPDNPFVDNGDGFREEIYAYGLRNPWRFSFDTLTGELWVADVGQNNWEEIDVVRSGGNYGWNTMEGAHCYSPSSGCNQTGLEPPVWEYDHGTGYSITGGYVYRGSSVGGMYGAYIYGDYGSGRIWALHYDGVNATNKELFDTSLNIASFGVGHDDEIYVVAFNGDQLYALRPAV